MAFKKKVKLKYGEWEVPAGGPDCPKPPASSTWRLSPSLAPGGGLYCRGGGLKGEIISTSPLPILLLLQ